MAHEFQEDISTIRTGSNVESVPCKLPRTIYISLQTYSSWYASVFGGSLPKPPGVSFHVPHYHLLVWEVGLPQERAITEDPRGLRRNTAS